MTTIPESVDRPDRKGLITRFIGIIVSPQETFLSVVALPRWFGMLALVTIVLAGATTVFLSTDVGRRALLEQQIAGMESLGLEVSATQHAEMERRVGLSAYVGGAAQLVAVPTMYVLLTGIIFAVFNGGMGGTATFNQVFAVVAHAGAISAAQQLFVLPLNYVRESVSSPTSLRALLPLLPDDAFIGHLLGAIDVFTVWWLIVLAVGLAVLYKRQTRSVATMLLVVYGVIALIIAGVQISVGGSYP